MDTVNVNNNYYVYARRKGLKEYNSYISQGRNGYLPFLEGILNKVDIVSEVDLGIIDIPLKKVKGTYTYMRSTSFARNFMPVMEDDTEFAQKWNKVYDIQVTEGLRDAVKAYEYLNWYYIVEGNKRISVLKYLDFYSFQGQVSRLIPKYDETNKDIRIYYEFLDFYKNTSINDIWFTKEGSFKELWEYIKDYDPKNKLVSKEEKYKYFLNAVYRVFKKVYNNNGGVTLPYTTGDAFLEYIKIHGVPISVYEDELEPQVKRLVQEIKLDKIEIQTEPTQKKQALKFSVFTPNRKPEIIKVAFAHSLDSKSSSWTYSHELARQHVDNVFNDQVETSVLFNLNNDVDAFDGMTKLVKDENTVIFTTNPGLINSTLKAAFEYPNVTFLNCSGVHSFKHVNTYFGRIHEPRFLSGIIAGIMTKNNRIGYVGTSPIPEIICTINAFALGAKMVNPNVEILVEWTNNWDDTKKARKAATILAEKGVDIVSQHNTLANRNYFKEYGVYTLKKNNETGEFEPDEYLGVPVWNWGIFYEKIIKGIMYKRTGLSINTHVTNYWWGMDSGILDFFYSAKSIPKDTAKLIKLVKQSIISKSFNIFKGPLHDREGNLKILDDEIASREQILSMDWLVEGVIGEIPNLNMKNTYNELSIGKLLGHEN